MADNILRGIIQLEAKGVAQTTSAVSAAVSKTEASLKKLPSASNAATLSLSNLSRVAQDAPFGFLGIANNINPLLESFQRLKQTTGSTGGALKALGSSLTGAGGLGLAVGVVSSLLVVFGDKLFGSSKAAKEAKDANKELSESISGIFNEVAKEATAVGSLLTVLKSETETRERRLGAIKELQQIQPDIFKGLKLEGDAVIGLDAAYAAYLANLKNVLAAKILQARIEQKITELLEKQGVGATKLEQGLIKASDAIRKFQEGKKDIFGQPVISADPTKKEITKLEDDIKGLFDDLTQFTKGINVKVDKVKVKTNKVEIDGRPKLGSIDLELDSIFDPTEKSKLQKALDGLFSNLTAKVPISIPAPNFKQSRRGQMPPDEVKALEDRYNALGGVITDFVTPAFGAFFDTIAKGGNAFKAFGQAVIQSLTQLITKLITTVALAAILSAVTGGAAGVGFKGASGFKDIFALLSGFGGARAGGGPVSANKAYLVGENGPEMFSPGVNGNIIPNGRLSSMRGVSGGFSGGSVVFEIRGNTLVGVLANANKSQGRLT